MAESFAVGDLVELLPSSTIPQNLQHLVGQIFTVTAVEMLDPEFPRTSAIGCHLTGDYWAAYRVLRKVRPPPELGSWSALERLTRWNPTRVEA